VRRKGGEDLDLSASLRFCTSMDTIHLSKYPSSSIGKFLVKLSLSCYSFCGFIIRSCSGWPLIKIG
jgi:hypothetical protein